MMSVARGDTDHHVRKVPGIGSALANVDVMLLVKKLFEKIMLNLILAWDLLQYEVWTTLVRETAILKVFHITCDRPHDLHHEYDDVGSNTV